MNRLNALPYILILVTGQIWGATFSLTLIATADGTHPFILASAQVAICSFFFVLICLGCKIDIFRLKHLRHYCLLAAVGIAFPNEKCGGHHSGNDSYFY
jgi:drug/metabolite transporter (DMT)-like permease